MICFRCQQNFPPTGRLVSARHVLSQYWGTFTRTFLTMFEARLHVSMTSQLVSSGKQSACTPTWGVSWLTLLYTLHSTKISDAGIKAMNCSCNKHVFFPAPENTLRAQKPPISDSSSSSSSSQYRSCSQTGLHLAVPSWTMWANGLLWSLWPIGQGWPGLPACFSGTWEDESRHGVRYFWENSQDILQATLWWTNIAIENGHWNSGFSH